MFVSCLCVSSKKFCEVTKNTKKISTGRDPWYFFCKFPIQKAEKGNKKKFMQNSASTFIRTNRSEDYRINAEFDGIGKITLTLTDEKRLTRFSRVFTKQRIRKITREVGSEKKIDVLWKMLFMGLTKSTKKVKISILPRDEADLLLKMNKIQTVCNKSQEDNHIYIILHLKTEIENLYFPLKLKERSYTNDEMMGMLLSLKRTNDKLKASRKTEENIKLKEKVKKLEKEVQSIKQQKDNEIETLRSKLTKYESYSFPTPHSRAAKLYAKEAIRKRMISDIEMML